MEAKSLDFKHICSLVFYFFFFFLKPLDKGLEKSPKTKIGRNSVAADWGQWRAWAGSHDELLH